MAEFTAEVQKLSLSSVKHQAIKTCGKVEVQLHAFLTSLDECQRSASHMDTLPLRKETLVPSGQEAGWAPELFHMLHRREHSSLMLGN
jgi:hypothetical protein